MSEDFRRIFPTGLFYGGRKIAITYSRIKTATILWIASIYSWIKTTLIILLIATIYSRVKTTFTMIWIATIHSRIKTTPSTLWTATIYSRTKTTLTILWIATIYSRIKTTLTSYALDCYNTLKDQDYSYYTLDCYNVLKDQDYSYYTLDCYYILKDQYSFHKLFLNSYYSFRYHAPYSFRLVIVHCLNITIAPMIWSLATLVIYSSNTLLQGCKTLSMITRFYSRLQGSLYSLTSWFSKAITLSGYHCSDLALPRQTPPLITRTIQNKHHRSAVQTVAGVACPGIATRCHSPPGTRLDGRSSECKVYLFGYLWGSQ